MLIYAPLGGGSKNIQVIAGKPKNFHNKNNNLINLLILVIS